MSTVKSNYGDVFVTQPGALTALNKEGNYVPGRQYMLKGKTLIEKGDYLVTPYQTKIEVLERTEYWVLCCLDKKSWYIFPIQKGDLIDTSHYFKSGFNDVFEIVHAEFLKKVAETESTIREKAKKDEAVQAAEKLRIESDKRKADAGNRKLVIQKAIQGLTTGKDITAIMNDTEIRILMEDYIFLETLLKIRAL